MADANLENILSRYGISASAHITQIYRSAWDVDGAFILKSNGSREELEKSVRLNRLLLSEGVPVVEYIGAADGSPHVFAEDTYWCLMKKIRGAEFDPYIGDPKQNGILLGGAVAVLHRALKNIEDQIEAPDADFLNEFTTWIFPELQKSDLLLTDGLTDSLSRFLERDYPALPRQPIHRDLHLSNLLFENGALTGYLDFDMCQRNARVFDFVYLGCSQLVENYKDEARLQAWRVIFGGIMQGYSASLPLLENEIKAIPALFVFDEALFTAFYVKIGQPDTAKKCADAANWLYAHIAELIG